MHQLKSLILGAVTVSMLVSCSIEAPDPPNIIFIMADDLGYGDLGCYGQEKIRTPSLDRMAAEGMRFTDFYAGSPVCAPSRCVLMTGRHSGHAYIRGNFEVRPEGQLPLPDRLLTVAEMLKTAGYVTGGIGKWGLGGPASEGHPNKQGFDYWYGHLCQRKAHSYYPDYVWENQEKVVFEMNDPAGQQGEYIHDYFTAKALDFIRTNASVPFFLYLPYTIPHLEFVAPEESMQEYRGMFPETPFAGTGYHEELPESPDIPFPGNYGAQSHPRAAYAAMITRMDRDIGRINALLEELGIGGQTLVMFTSDNGAAQGKSADAAFFRSNGQLRGTKGRIYEGGIRVPLIVKWPEVIEPGSVSRHAAAFWDVLPTFAEIAGFKDLPATDGISFLKTLRGEPGQAVHDFLYWEFKQNNIPMQAVRMGDLKGVKLGGEDLQLYDLGTDISEQHDLSAQEPETCRQLQEIMEQARTESELFPLFE